MALYQLLISKMENSGNATETAELWMTLIFY
jgi:hypothetical protein